MKKLKKFFADNLFLLIIVGSHIVGIALAMWISYMIFTSDLPAFVKYLLLR